MLVSSPQISTSLTYSKPALYGGLRLQLITCALVFILLVFASQFGFSFERGGANTATAALSGASASPNLLVRSQTALVYFLCLVLIFPNSFSIASDFRRFRVVSALLMYAGFSVLWSQDPRASLVSTVFLSLNVAFAFYLSHLRPNDVLKLLVIVGTIAAVTSIFLVLVFPQYGLQLRSSYANGAWQGIFGHKNICGTEMSLLLLPIFFVRFEAGRRLVFRSFYVLIIFLIIAMSRSVQAWLVCVCCLGFVGLVHLLAKAGRKDRLLLAAAVAAITVSLALFLVLERDSFLALLGKDTSLTGRTEIWSVLLRSVMRRPWVGFGYRAFWVGLNGESASVTIATQWTGITYAENGLLELALELGLIGVGLYVWVYLRAFRDAAYCLKRDARSAVLWYSAVLFFVAVSNIAGGEVLAPSDLECVVPLVAYFGLRREALRLRSGGA